MSDYKPSKFIDFHVHVFPEDVAPKAAAMFKGVYGFPPLSDCTVAGTLEYMDRVGVDIFVPQPVATKPLQVQSINDWVVGVRSERVIPFGGMHPDYPNVREEIDRLVDLGVPGIKLQPDWQEFYPDDEKAFPIYEAAEGRLAVLFHIGGGIEEREEIRATPERVLQVHQKFPTLTIIAAHGGGYRCWQDAERFLWQTGVYIDISYCHEEEFSTPEMVRLIKSHGVEKILFASDFPFADTEKDIRRLIDLPLTAEERETIAWKNAAGILGKK